MRRGSAAKFHNRRLSWMLAHLELLDGVPALNQDVDDTGRQQLERLELAMVAAGLFGQSPSPSRRETVRRLVGEIRAGKSTEAHW